MNEYLVYLRGRLYDLRDIAEDTLRNLLHWAEDDIDTIKEKFAITDSDYIVYAMFYLQDAILKIYKYLDKNKEVMLYKEDKGTASKESFKAEMARVAQPDPLEDVDDLPTTVIVNIDKIGYNAEDGDDLYECITNYLSDTYGYCIYGYDTEDLDTTTGNITVTNIEWDTKE